MPLIFQTQLRRLVWIIASIVLMDAVSGNHLCVTLMMTVEMDRMKLVVVCYFNDQMIVGSFENIAATINFKMST